MCLFKMLKRNKVKQSDKNKRGKVKQGKAKQSKAKQSKVKQSKTKQGANLKQKQKKKSKYNFENLHAVESSSTSISKSAKFEMICPFMVTLLAS